MAQTENMSKTSKCITINCGICGSELYSDGPKVPLLDTLKVEHPFPTLVPLKHPGSTTGCTTWENLQSSRIIQKTKVSSIFPHRYLALALYTLSNPLMV